MYSELETIEGIFISESKNRFLCRVLIEGTIEECYVPSSSRIENYLNLINKKVLLTKNSGKNNRTNYSLFAVLYYNKYILLNLNKVNELLSYYIKQYRFRHCIIKREEVINGYKSDLIIKGLSDNKNKIIEAKGIIDIRNVIVFPKVHSARALNQLQHISSLLDDNHILEYYFVSLSPIVKEIIINNSSPDYYNLLKKCLDKGLKLKGISIDLDSKKNLSFNTLKINMEKQGFVGE